MKQLSSEYELSSHFDEKLFWNFQFMDIIINTLDLLRKERKE